ncbi:MAG: hypothetical protein IJY72_05000, partial [Akkermansia sp.]|nr:hypothetical protein [Akkermansia sp.]
IHVYSIDEVFMDVTPYLKARKATPREFAGEIILDVLNTTGITATALLHAVLTGAASPIKVDVAGGDSLSVAFTRIGSTEFSDVTLTGPATIVFRGEISVPS